MPNVRLGLQGPSITTVRLRWPSDLGFPARAHPPPICSIYKTGLEASPSETNFSSSVAERRQRSRADFLHCVRHFGSLRSFFFLSVVVVQSDLRRSSDESKTATIWRAAAPGLLVFKSLMIASFFFFSVGVQTFFLCFSFSPVSFLLGFSSSFLFRDSGDVMSTINLVRVSDQTVTDYPLTNTLISLSLSWLISWFFFLFFVLISAFLLLGFWVINGSVITCPLSCGRYTLFRLLESWAENPMCFLWEPFVCQCVSQSFWKKRFFVK